MEKRKQASRTPNASRNTTSRSMSERQGVTRLANLAAAFGVREACFRFGLSHASMHFGIGRTENWKAVFISGSMPMGRAEAPFRPAQKVRRSPGHNSRANDEIRNEFLSKKESPSRWV